MTGFLRETILGYCIFPVKTYTPGPHSWLTFFDFSSISGNLDALNFVALYNQCFIRLPALPLLIIGFLLSNVSHLYLMYLLDSFYQFLNHFLASFPSLDSMTLLESLFSNSIHKSLISLNFPIQTTTDDWYLLAEGLINASWFCSLEQLSNSWHCFQEPLKISFIIPVLVYFSSL